MSLISGSYSLPSPTAAPTWPVEALRVGIVEKEAAGNLRPEFVGKEASKCVRERFLRGEQCKADFCGRFLVAARLTNLRSENISID